MNIKAATADLKNIIREPYAWPGGYPKVLLMRDNVCLCKDCARSNFRLILRATRNPGSDRQWEAHSTFINWENNDLYCENCNARIEPAYGDD